MTLTQFNDKWNNYLIAGAYGLDIDHQEIIIFLDGEFEKELLINSSFTYSQIKIKFGKCRIYTTSSKKTEWESEIDLIMGNTP